MGKTFKDMNMMNNYSFDRTAGHRTARWTETKSLDKLVRIAKYEFVHENSCRYDEEDSYRDMMAQFLSLEFNPRHNCNLCTEDVIL